MQYKRSVIEVKIRLEGVPGWGHKPEDHVDMIRDLLDNSIPHYIPQVRLIRTELEPGEED